MELCFQKHLLELELYLHQMELLLRDDHFQEVEGALLFLHPSCYYYLRESKGEERLVEDQDQEREEEEAALQPTWCYSKE